MAKPRCKLCGCLLENCRCMEVSGEVKFIDGVTFRCPRTNRVVNVKQCADCRFLIARCTKGGS